MAPSPPSEGTTVTRLWILHGAFWLVLMAAVWTAWVVSGDFAVNSIGRGQEPDWYLITVRCAEIGLGVIFTGWCVWHFVVKPKLRTGSFSFDGLFFIGCFLMVFQEPWMNWINLQFLYATTFVNFGFWGPEIPGWYLPNAELIPMPLLYFAAYIWMVGFGAWAGARFMRFQRRKNPALSNGRLIAQTFGVMVLVDLIGEGIGTHAQLWNYPSVIPEVTLWAGTDHQFPLYEALIWPSTFILLSSMYYFRDDQGRTFMERGIDRIRFRSARMKTLARFAAIAGYCQLAILVTFNIPYQIIGLHTVPVPEVYLKRPWRMAGVCGPGTEYNCRQVDANHPRLQSEPQ
jgi:Spirocyclase AveC-like